MGNGAQTKNENSSSLSSWKAWKAANLPVQQPDKVMAVRNSLHFLIKLW
jgi:hypothetical protein